MRVFVALDIPTDVRQKLGQYLDRVRPLAPDARWSRIESLHVTLKFIGEIGESQVSEMKLALTSVKVSPFELKFGGIGFFPNPRSARVFWTGVSASEALPQLASLIENAAERLGIAREKRAYQAHLTLARAPEGRDSRHCFRLLHERLSAEESPYFGTMSAQEFFLYQSQIMRGGARYSKLQRFPLQ